MSKFSLLLLIIGTAANLNIASGSTFVRYSTLNPEGTQIAFSFQGDIWTVPMTGGRATRITIHQAYDRDPHWSPDGLKIAFSSNRFGQPDVFIINSEGGVPERITWHSASDILTDWTNNNELIFRSDRTCRQVERDNEIQIVSAAGGTPRRLMDALGSEPVMSPNGRFVAMVMGSCRLPREQYRGSANRDIWLYDTEQHTFIQLTTFEGQDYHPVWKDNHNIYFISARSGKYNIHFMRIDGEGKVIEGPVQVTDEKDDQIRHFDLSSSSGLIVFEKDINLYSITIEGGEVSRLNIDISTDYRFDPYENKVFSDQISEYRVSPDGRYSAFIVHGDVFITENEKDKSLTHNLTNSSSREKDVDWLNDSVVIYSSDRDGKYDLYETRSADPDEPDLFKSLKRETLKVSDDPEDERAAVVSHDGRRLVFIRGGNFGAMDFVLANISKDGGLSEEEVLLSGWSAPAGVCWSPDNNWLAYSQKDLTFNSEIFIHPVNGAGERANVSMHPRGDYSPVWSPDGSKLGFISARNNRDNDIWFAWLRIDDSQKTEEDWEAEKEDENSKNEGSEAFKAGKKSKQTKEKEEPLRIDVEKIHDRLVQLTSLAGNEGNLAISKDGETFYFTSRSPEAKAPDLYEIKWNKKFLKEVTRGGAGPSNVNLDNQGKYLYSLSRGKLSRISTNGNKTENLPISAKLKIDYKAELEQIFDEAWRSLRDGFYDPQYNGQDFMALRDKFRPYCMAASTKTDFMDMFNIMLGQLNASHMGLYGKDREETQNEHTGLLGIDIFPQKEGVKILRVIPESPADMISSKLYKDEVIRWVNGEKVSEVKNFWSMLTNTASEKVLLEVANSKGELRDVVIRPVRSLRNELYNEWVRDRRKLTEKYSGGKLGYLHIRGMDMVSFERFERELTSAGYGKQAIVIDVRYNGGGSTTDYLMAILNVKQHAYTIPRGAEPTLANNNKYRQYYPFSERLPYFAWNKPSIALCNENSYSNAEIFSHAYKNLGIGTLVGQPTFGAVISTSAVRLVDGSYVRMPFRGWFIKKTDRNMDFTPARPDVIVRNSPDYKAKGEDEQLEKACQIMLEQLAEQE